MRKHDKILNAQNKNSAKSTSAAFDIAAASYDDIFTHSTTGRAQRMLVHGFLEGLLGKLPRKSNILELNCGTGEDAVWFANLGHEVHATDISEQMIEQVQEKSQGRVNTQVISAAQLEALQNVGDHEFDLVFSNFGGLNCLSPDEVAKMGAQLARLTTKESKFVFVVMPRFCLQETIYGFLRGNWQLGTRRWRLQKVSASLNGGTDAFPIWYYSPEAFGELLGDDFSLVSARPIGFFVPPSALERFFCKRKRLVKVLKWMDSVLPRTFANWSDHALLEFECRK